MLIIHHNGGCRKEPPEKLLEVLVSQPLDSRFEFYGGFWKQDPASHWNKQPLFPNHPGAVSFYGNFVKLSWGFHITTDEPGWIERLTTAIEQNQQSPAYLAQGANRVCCIDPDYPPTFVTSHRVGSDVLVCESFYFDTANRYLINGKQAGQKAYYKRLRNTSKEVSQ